MPRANRHHIPGQVWHITLELQRLCGFSVAGTCQKQYKHWVEEAVGNGNLQREGCWTESVAVGNRGFIEETKAQLGVKATGRGILEQRDAQFVLREKPAPYNAGFATGRVALSPENTCFSDNVFRRFACLQKKGTP